MQADDDNDDVTSTSTSTSDDNVSFTPITSDLPLHQILMVDLNQGYTFRSVIDTVQAINMEGNFIFTKDRIFYCETDADSVITVHMVILTDELPYYVYKAQSEYIMFGLTLKYLKSATQSTWKKDGLRMHMFANDPCLYIQIVSGSARHSSNQDYYQIMFKNIVKPAMKLEEYQRRDNDPNCTVPLGEFATMCANINRMSATTVTITGYAKGVRFEAESPGAITRRSFSYGFCPPDKVTFNNYSAPISNLNEFLKRLTVSPNGNNQNNDQQLVPLVNDTPVRIVINAAVMKKLAKITNISTPFSAVKIYMEHNKPVKIVSHIGNYGYMTLYLRGKN